MPETRQFTVRLKRTLMYSVTVKAEHEDQAQDEAIGLVEDGGESPINPRTEAEVVSCKEEDDDVNEDEKW